MGPFFRKTVVLWWLLSTTLPAVAKGDNIPFVDFQMMVTEAMAVSPSLTPYKRDLHKAKVAVSETSSLLLPRFFTGRKLPERQTPSLYEEEAEDTEDAEESVPEWLWTGSVSATQVLYPGSLGLRLEGQQVALEKAEARLRQARLDAGLAAALLYLDYLRVAYRMSCIEKTLALAGQEKDRQGLLPGTGEGISGEKERWIAIQENWEAKQVRVVKELLGLRKKMNRIRRRPPAEPFRPRELLGEPLEREMPLERCLADGGAVVGFLNGLVSSALEAAPELALLEAGKKEQEHALLQRERMCKVPSFNLIGQMDQHFLVEKSGASDWRNFSITPDERDWTVLLSLQVPFCFLWQPVRNVQDMERVREKGISRRALEETIFWKIEKKVTDLMASRVHLQDSRTLAAVAIEDRKKALADYRKHHISTEDLATAWRLAFGADQVVADATILYLRDLMHLQRAAGSFFLLTENGPLCPDP